VLSTLALILAQFPVGSTRAKWIYIIIVILFNFLAAAAVIYSQYYTINKAKTEASERRETREQIATFIHEGNDLLGRIRNNDIPSEETQAAANNWATQVEAFLAQRLDNSYVLRFRSAANLPLGEPVGLDEQRLSYWRGVRIRIVNLERFSSELPR
jgi:hypothetical protein